MLTDKFFVIAELGHDATLWLLLLLSVMSIASIFERFMSLRPLKSRSKKIAELMQDAIRSNSLKDIKDMSKDRDSVEGRALAYGLRHLEDNGVPGLEEVFDSYALTERPRLERYLNFLATVGANAPLIGLLGTVFGIMDAFRELASSQGDATLVMVGISKALVATAVGLLVAIPAVISYNYFQREVRGIFQNLESAKSLCLAYAKTLKGA